ncbi:hypothetical protein SacazDRAFT_02566 [Saccharomonospora azurea NA-128]|uniref:Uncharacterized protein n=1 Tax=Saccharomonospora azurea NA-128 TaxID=882081 RepID=H8G8U4_9PSEU|nr:hypothetical protein SacazDRAFT_02566 [Saccharomonospora azurea NA-128]
MVGWPSLCQFSQGPDRCCRRRAGYPSAVEFLFTALMVLVVVASVWFSAYVVYRLYTDH